MSTVNIKIGPGTYPVACGDGEEAQVEKLAKIIDEKYSQLGDARAPRESQNLLFTALLLADELAEARSQDFQENQTGHKDDEKPEGKKAELKAEIKLLRAANQALNEELEDMRNDPQRKSGLFVDDRSDAKALAGKLEELATRAEATADALEGYAPGS